jgi:hydroxymethylpyrimidine pyrophosphatase-like HAD family hydrolase/fructoselysine-6-P-deglycase FrlB-like protein
LGKPFATELANLSHTYSWALAEPIECLARWVRRAVKAPLAVVGSGGSYTSAVFASALHTLFAGRPAKTMTPLELVASPLHLADVTLLLLSGSGSNPDILACLDRVRASPPMRFGILCARRGSPLASAATCLGDESVHEHEPPSGRDGFLATNTLIATCVLLTRAYASAWSNANPLPPTLAELAHPRVREPEFADDLEDRCRPLWERETTVVLHGYSSQSAAVDLESKFTEAALGHLQTADYRNFAHGRHHWFARHSAASGVFAIVAPEDRMMAERTLRLLPEDIPVVRLDLPHDGYCGALAGIAVGMHVVGLAGRARGMDPGRPTVPTFGRQLYHLGGLRVPPSPEPGLTTEEAAAIERKAGYGVTTLAAQGRLGSWRSAFSIFRQSLQGSTFSAVIFDYDGTLCGAADRFTGPGTEIVQRLKELARAGVIIGIATGRGKSVRQDLRRVLPERSLWARVLVGYHNGGEIGWLSDGTLPPPTDGLDGTLQSLAKAMQADTHLSGLVKLEAKLRQITLELSAEADSDEVWEWAERLANRHADPGVTLVRSSHSIDALAPGVSKSLLVARVRKEITQRGLGGQVLCIGDKGRKPGNDFALLEEPCSLSVDEVSSNPTTCWNLAGSSGRCVAATIVYLRSLRIGPGVFTVHL